MRVNPAMTNRPSASWGQLGHGLFPLRRDMDRETALLTLDARVDCAGSVGKALRPGVRACRLTSWRRRGLVPGVISRRPVLRLGAPVLALLSVSGAAWWEARAAGESVAAQARDLMTQVEADASVQQLVSP